MTSGRPGRAASRDIYRRKQKHIDIHNLIEACRKYPQIPATFDGSLPSEALGEEYPIRIGQTYFFDSLGEKGLLGTVTAATVLESEKKVYIGVAAEDGTNCILTETMSDEALADYKAHPEAFFGIIQHVGKKTEDPYELFEFFLESYKNTPKEKLLEFIRGAPERERSQMEQPDLAIEYAERLVAMAVNLPK